MPGVGLRIGAAVAGLLLLPGIAAADHHLPGPHLTPSDMALMKAIGPRLYRRDDALKGASESWSNPETGHNGTITVLDVFERGAQPCRLVRYDLAFPDSMPASYKIVWCLQPGEGWKITQSTAPQ